MIFNLITKAKELFYKNGKTVEGALDELNESLKELPKTKLLSEVSVLSVEENGRYYVGNALGLPDGVGKYGYLDVHNYDDSGSNRKIEWTPSNSNVTYVNVKDGDTWIGWDSHALNSDLLSKFGSLNLVSIVLGSGKSVQLTSGSSYLLMIKPTFNQSGVGLYFIGSYSVSRNQEMVKISEDELTTVEYVNDGTYNSKIKITNNSTIANINIHVLGTSEIFQS